MGEVHFTSLNSVMHRDGDDPEKPYTQFGYYNKDLKELVLCDVQNPETSRNFHTHKNEHGETIGNPISYEEAIDILHEWAIAKHQMDIYRCDEMLERQEELLEHKKNLQQLAKAKEEEQKQAEIAQRKEQRLRGESNVLSFKRG